MQKFNDVLKAITVSKYEITVNGLLLTYTYKGKEYHLIADEQQTCDLLENAGIILGHDVYNTYSGTITEVQFETTDQHGNKRKVKYEFDHYRLTNTLSQIEAIRIAATHEQNKALNTLINQAKLEMI